MAATFHIKVTESAQQLKDHQRTVAVYMRPRIKMLTLIAKGMTTVSTLCAKLGISSPTLRDWKNRYHHGGIEALLREKRGGDKRSGISAAQKQLIAQKLSNPHDAFRSYGEAQAWLKTALGIHKEYHALNKYLKNNFGTKLKVGRKSHVKKDQAAIAVFKKACPRSLNVSATDRFHPPPAPPSGFM
jgi:transposase